MKEELNKLMKEFLDDINDIERERARRNSIAPTFENFVRWLDKRTWDIE